MKPAPTEIFTSRTGKVNPKVIDEKASCHVFFCIRWSSLQVRVVRQRELSLGNAQRQVGKSLLRVEVDLRFRFLREFDSCGAVDLLSDALELRLYTFLEL